MKDFYIDFDYPVDILIEIDKYILAGAYYYNEKNKQRSGKIYFIDKKNKKVEKEILTSGTLCLFYKEFIYSANSQDISIFDIEGNLIKKIKTKFINTFIECKDEIIVCNTNGEVLIFDYDLNLIQKLKVSNESVWITKKIFDKLYIGTETGHTFEFKDNLKEICEKREGITYIENIKDKILFSSYDDNLLIYDVNNKKIEIIYKVGSFWNIKYKNEKYYCAAIYDGIKIFNKNFYLIEHIKTKSICYTFLIQEDKIIYSSFYENRVYFKKIKNNLSLNFN